ncbi:MAG: hypothetical protein WBL72_03010, partial [Thermoguttaceae bacterium]
TRYEKETSRMTDKQQTTSKQVPIKVLVFGEITASVFEKQSLTGYRFYDYELTRTWKSMSTKKEAHGSTFFERNLDDIVTAARAASACIHAMLNPTLPADASNEPLEDYELESRKMLAEDERVRGE